MAERKKPKFWRKDWNKKIKLGSKRKSIRKWRRPTGLDNKNRLTRKGRAKAVNIGWGNAKKDKGKINGLVPIRVENVEQLKNVDKKVNGIIVASVGKKKKQEIIQQAEKDGIKILNKYKKSNEKVENKENGEKTQ